MNQVVMVPIPVTPEAAEALREDPGKLSIVGRMVSQALRPDPARADPLSDLLDRLPRDPAAPPLTDADITAEVAAARAGNYP